MLTVDLEKIRKNKTGEKITTDNFLCFNVNFHNPKFTWGRAFLFFASD